MAEPNDSENGNVKCSLVNCDGDYEPRSILHTVRHDGGVVVIDHVPAGVCNLCGDVLLEPQTVRRIEAMLRSLDQPDRAVPLYEYVA